jgi:predicted GH43/DUF377 family glycosyl hydrolase
MSTPPFPYRLVRVGVIMTPQADDPDEAEGVCNPGALLGRDGTPWLYPRVVAAGNRSRVARARILLEDGVPTGVAREGIVLEPERTWERSDRWGGVEDPRTTWVPSLDTYLMTYVAFGPLGPRPALAASRDAVVWERLGPMQFTYDEVPDVDLNLFPNKDLLWFPEVVPDPEGRPSYAFVHRPMWDLGGQKVELPSSVSDPRASIWISYVPAEEAQADLRSLLRPRGHREVLGPQYDWEALKVGGGPPPVRVPEGWLLLHHGVSGEIVDDPFTPQKNVFYAAGGVLLSAEDPSVVLSRTSEPLLSPELAEERVGMVGNVVFPTAILTIEDADYVFYGMADAAIGVARLERVET